ncbi:hypothetical protein GCM10023066_56390 [Nocardioides kongjuensis]
MLHGEHRERGPRLPPALEDLVDPSTYASTKARLSGTRAAYARRARSTSSARRARTSHSSALGPNSSATGPFRPAPLDLELPGPVLGRGAALLAGHLEHGTPKTLGIP